PSSSASFTIAALFMWIVIFSAVLLITQLIARFVDWRISGGTVVATHAKQLVSRQFSLKSLVLLMTLCAVLLGFGREIGQHLNVDTAAYFPIPVSYLLLNACIIWMLIIPAVLVALAMLLPCPTVRHFVRIALLWCAITSSVSGIYVAI